LPDDPLADVSHEPLRAANDERCRTPESPEAGVVPAQRPPLDRFVATLRQFFAPSNRDEPTDSDPPLEPDTGDLAAEGSVVSVRSFAEELDDLLPIARDETKRHDESEANPPALDAASEAHDPSESPEPPHEPMKIAAPARPSLERIVPLTRMPLRPQALEITWPLLAPEGTVLESRSERHAFLARLTTAGNPEDEALLVCAYREEDAGGRLIALRAICAARLDVAHDLCVDALHVGSDEERSLAIDALLASGRRDAVTPAFSDRLDALAAQAALGFVGSQQRADYVAALSPHVDRTRLEAILGLLAGIVE
jgi:hypothetical protein